MSFLIAKIFLLITIVENNIQSVHPDAFSEVSSQVFIFLTNNLCISEDFMGEVEVTRAISKRCKPKELATEKLETRNDDE